MSITYMTNYQKNKKLKLNSPPLGLGLVLSVDLPYDILALIASFTHQDVLCSFRATNTHMRDRLTPLMHIQLQRWCVGEADLPLSLLQRARSCTVIYSPWFPFDYTELRRIPTSCKIFLINKHVQQPDCQRQLYCHNFETALKSCSNIECCTVNSWLISPDYNAIAACAP